MGDIFDIFRKLETQGGSPAVPNQPIRYIIAGLGNPGKTYARTRHNTGFLCMDTVCETYHAVTDRARFQALCGEATIADARCLLMRPQTMMNLSGAAVADAATFYKIPPAHIIVISDDINLHVGAMRIRTKGSDGGQRGIRSIINCLGTDEFPRIRIGVGQKPSPDYDLADWVLSNFTPAELDTLRALFPIACQGIEYLIRGQAEKAMQVCNRK